MSIRGRPGHICIATTTILEKKKRNKSYTTICRMLNNTEASFFTFFPRLDHIVVSTMTKEKSTNTDSWLWFNALNTIFGVILKNNQSVDLKHFFVVVVRVGGGQFGEGSEKLEKQYILVLFLMAITRKHWYLSQPDYKYVWFYRQPELFKLELNHSLPCCHLRHHKCNV